MRRAAWCIALCSFLSAGIAHADEASPSFTVTTSPGKKGQKAPIPSPRPLDAPPSVTPTSSAVSSALVLRPPAFAATPRGKATIALASLGGALVIAGAVTGSLALSSYHDYTRGCDGGTTCDAGQHDHAKALAHATDPLLFVGGAALVASLVVALVHRRPARR